MTNAVEQLLALDASRIKKPTKTVKLKLGKFDGLELEFKIEAVDPEIMSELKESMIRFESKTEAMRVEGSYNVTVMTIIEGCPSVFRNKEVQDHFKAATPKELVKILLTSGEMDKLKDEIDAISGYAKEKDIKN